MDYKKKYEDALERAREWSETKNGYYTPKKLCEKIFPELRKNEDEHLEKIKKDIISYLLNRKIDSIAESSATEKWIDWLEKQKLTKNINKEEEEVRQYLIRTMKQNDINVPMVQKALAWLEKQGGQKYIPKYKIGDYVKNTNYKGEPIYEIVYMDKECYICEYRGKERIGDKAVMHFSFDNPYLRLVQKPANKVEPKFKVGNFIANDYCRGKIIKITDDAYLLDTGQGIPFSCEHNVHLWTIQDAKDGDILCTYECDEPKIVFILKGTPKKHYALSYYCYYNIMYPHFGPDSEKGCLAPNDEDVKPATKEQRDILKKTMTNAGYEWDTEKKELKKIEQKSDSFCKKHCKGFQETGKCFADGDCKAKREAESINKAEPKFKVGDWCIDNEDGTIFQIVKVLDNTYIYETTEGKEYSCTHYSLENDAKLWTIQDAKDGDMLFQDLIGGKTFIYSGINPDMAILYSFIISNDGEYVLPYHIGKPNTGIGTIEDNKNIIHPATKEQHDLLFQKIKEEGYEWDTDKKELKKIEKKPDWSEEDECCMTECINAIATKDGWSFEEKRKTKHWLESLKHRIGKI